MGCLFGIATFLANNRRANAVRPARAAPRKEQLLIDPPKGNLVVPAALEPGRFKKERPSREREVPFNLLQANE